MSPATSTDPATSLSDADMDEEPSDFDESRFAEQYEFFELRDRLMTDKAMVEQVRRLLSTCLSNARCLVKKTALPKIESAYSLGHTGPERQERAKALIKSGDYIFPCTQ
ncbi:hypothetical protein H0H81_006791, partial [Sphagnurus paluster]